MGTFLNPQTTGGAVAGGGGAEAGQRAYLNHDGVYSFYTTIALAEAAAVANDTITCFGIFDEAGLGKADVGYFFMPGSGITYTGASTEGIFDDGGVAMTFRVGGDGTFTRDAAAAVASQGGIIDLRSASTVYFECTRMSNNQYNSSIYAESGSTIYLDVEYLSSTFLGIYVNGASIRGKIAEMYCPSERGISLSGSSPGEVYLEVGKLTALYWALDINNSGMTSFIRVQKIVTTYADFPAIKMSSGALYLDIQGEVSAAGVAMEVIGGTATVEGRIKTTGANKHCIVKSGGVLRLESGSSLIANGTGKSIYSADAQNVVLLGDVSANADVEDPGVKITTRVGSLKIDSTYVN